MKCPYCGSSRIIERDGEYICIDCGTVLGSVYVYDTYMQSSPLLDGEEIDLTPIWKSVEKNVRKRDETRLGVYRRLKVINDIFRTRRESYSIYRAYDCILFIARAFGISNEYVEEAKHVFRKILNKEGSSSTTYYQAAVAAVLYVVLSHNLPISTKQVINLCRLRGHKLTFESIRDSLINIKVRYNLRDRVLSHIKSGLTRLFNDSWVTIYPEAEKYLDSLRKSVIQSRSPPILAAAIIYCVSKRLGYKLRVEDIAKAVQVSPYTLRDYARKLCRN
ncbi:MAG: TFIIB-type zinc ribbon-containing protein [Vulcanisaeta sp.]|jgi:transcription initiation factor TFIIIB Brf1 subunit/transcription initiation factor TFIIB|uniref:TFIIB-type domain-containing protein n=1 Tax=Vulcanisaeta moutnovskia (strain 768-28) TaxID=985053 RepID=F0QTP6_VULM7|nr:TFIIB-type zinc ribbon-containing protein [Vulcanisaeta moutnovskia]ADY00512.1 hypothetical protein VMUT_0298 [Vulcanisaeta moutnovskia 768-28]